MPFEPEIAEEIIKLAGEIYFESDEQIIWKRTLTSD
jgi:hypothetical protein